MKKTVFIILFIALSLCLFVSCLCEPKDKVKNNATIKTCTLDKKPMGLIEYNSKYMVFEFVEGNKYECSCPFVIKEGLVDDFFSYNSVDNTLSILNPGHTPKETASLSAAKPCYIETMDFEGELVATLITYDSVTYTVFMGN